MAKGRNCGDMPVPLVDCCGMKILVLLCLGLALPLLAGESRGPQVGTETSGGYGLLGGWIGGQPQETE